jgi:hypothetical protein
MKCHMKKEVSLPHPVYVKIMIVECARNNSASFAPGALSLIMPLLPFLASVLDA